MSLLKQSFIKGTLILLAAGVVNRVLGFIPRIILPRVIGREGIGLYQLGFPFLIVMLTLLTGGIPLAIAKMVAEAESAGDEPKVRKILRTAMLFVCTFGVLFTALSLVAAPWVAANVLTDQRVYLIFVCMSPIVIIAGVSSVYRGYFQGRHNMIPTAVSQVIETVSRIFAVLFFAYKLLPYGVEYGAAGAMIGVLFGELCGMLVLLYQYRKNRNAYTQPAKRTKKPQPPNSGSGLRELLRISIPVTGSKLVSSCSYMLESILTTRSLVVAGIAATIATAQYGALQGMVIPILYLPTALTSSLAVSLVPSLSEAAARGDYQTIHKRLRQSLRLALVAGAPFAVVMYFLAEPLCYFLYNDRDAGTMLKMMAPVALFIYFQSPLSAALQVLNKPGAALLNSFIGAAIKLALISFLASLPQFGIIGAIIAGNVNIVLTTFLHWISVKRLLKFSMRMTDFYKVGIAMLLMAIGCLLLLHQEWTASEFLRFVCAGTVGAIIYFICIIKMGLIDNEDFRRIPWFGKIWTKL